MNAADLDNQVIILTGQGTIDSAVHAMKMGACDYLTKPFPLVDLEQRCRLVWERGRLGKENRQLKAVIKRQQPKIEMIGCSPPPMKEVFRLIERVAPTDEAVLIQGEIRVINTVRFLLFGPGLALRGDRPKSAKTSSDESKLCWDSVCFHRVNGKRSVSPDWSLLRLAKSKRLAVAPSRLHRRHVYM